MEQVVKEYKVDVHGVEHTFQYDDEDAKRLGLTSTDAKAAELPANKSRTPKNK